MQLWWPLRCPRTDDRSVLDGGFQSRGVVVNGRLTGSASAAAAVVAAGALVGMVLSPGAVGAQSGAGKADFERICAGCHGAEGVGDVGPPLVPFTRSNRELLGIVREGIGQMPALSVRDISDEEVAAVAEYLRGLSPAR